MCIRDRPNYELTDDPTKLAIELGDATTVLAEQSEAVTGTQPDALELVEQQVTIDVDQVTVSYTHLRAHETLRYLVCRLLLEKKKKKKIQT